jgi:BMFP domain-containing protein YqiC
VWRHLACAFAGACADRETKMTTDKQTLLQDLQNRLAELMRNSPASDIERNLKALLGQTFERLELVTRDEFDGYVELLGSLRARVARLEQAVDALERHASAPARDQD